MRGDQGLAKIDTDIDAAEVILMLAPETNGEVAVKAWEALARSRPRPHPSGLPKEDEKIRFRDIQAQPRKIISSPTWSGSRARRSATTPATPTSTN
jgi:nitrate reductase alpha subunit